MRERRHAGPLADPIYGKFAGKTNASSRFRNNADASDEADFGLSGRDYSMFIFGGLLTVVSQHLAAGFGQLRTILLKAGQDGEVTLVHYRAAETRDVARARLLLIRRAATLLRDGAGRNGYRQKRKRNEKSSHCVPLF
jgi:hypothetical protein